MVVGHQDFEYTLGCGTRASFHWAPYANNITSLVRNWTATGQSPRILVMGTALWHMLHVGLPRNYGHGLSWLADALRGLQAQQVRRACRASFGDVRGLGYCGSGKGKDQLK